MPLNIMGQAPKHSHVMRSIAMAGRVKRYHTWPTLQEQSVAAHSWRVATIYIQLFGLPRAEVLEYLLFHDCGELFAGDTPFYVKRCRPGLKTASDEASEHGLAVLGIALPELTSVEKGQVRCADLLEMYEMGAIESRMGNFYGIIVCANIVEALKEGPFGAKYESFMARLWPNGVVT
jgi:5'-deoxynucleotidase YfbR-like HD superfamily hydrolase